MKTNAMVIRKRMNKKPARVRGTTYDTDFKLKVVRTAENLSNSAAAALYNVPERNVRIWRREKLELQKSFLTNQPYNETAKERRQWLDDQVLFFIDKLNRRGTTITKEVICGKALKLAQDLKIPRNAFCASNSWFERIIKRASKRADKRASCPDDKIVEIFEEGPPLQLSNSTNEDYEVVDLGSDISSDVVVDELIGMCDECEEYKVDTDYDDLTSESASEKEPEFEPVYESALYNF